ncbi:MAG: PQQ-binding-like beta-propeller repeat protein [Candidatus Bathyarchaeia archaeon]
MRRLLVIFLVLSTSFTLVCLDGQLRAQPLVWRYTATGSVTSVAISSNGLYVAVGSKDGFIYLLDRLRGDKLWKYAVWSRINDVSISEDGSYVVAGGSNGILYFFDRNLTGNSYLWKYSLGTSVLSTSISGDGECVVVGCFDQRLYFFEKDQPSPLWSHKTEGKVGAVKLSVEGGFAVAGSDDGYVYVFDREYTRNTFISRFRAGAPIVSVSISRDGSCVAAGSLDGYVYFQDRFRNVEGYTWRHKVTSKVTSLDISSDGGYVAAGDSSGRTYLFDKNYTGNSYVWSYPTGGQLTVVSISGNGGLIASGSEKGIYLFNRAFKNNSFLWHLPVNAEIMDLEISKDGFSVVAGDEDGYVYMFWPTTPLTTLPLIVTVEETEETSLSSTPEITNKARMRVEVILLILVALAMSATYIIYVKKRRKAPEPKRGSKFSFGFGALDALLGGEVPRGYSIALSSPPCDQKDEVVKGFIKVGLDEGLTVYVSSTPDKILWFLDSPNLYVIICNPQAEEISPESANVEKIRNVENLTELNISLITLMEKIYEGRLTPSRICLDILDDILIQHKGPTTRKWLLEFLPRLKKMGGMILATVNPKMHHREDLHAVLSLFDGQVDITEEKVKGKVRRKLSVSRLYGLSYSKETLHI